MCLSSDKIRRVKYLLELNKNGVVFSAASCKKDIIFGTARKSFSRSYFVTTLVQCTTCTFEPAQSCNSEQIESF